MSDHQLQICILIVALLTFGVLTWYTFETMWLRIAAQDQLEALAKPCLTLAARLRDGFDALLDMHGAVGNMIAAADACKYFVLQNIGNGVALNVTYNFRSLDPEYPADSSTRHFVSVLPGAKVPMPEPMNASGFSRECELVFRFESIGGRRYQSTTTMNHHVLTNFRLESLETRRNASPNK